MLQYVMLRYTPYLAGLSSASREMADLVLEWVKISSGTYDLIGLEKMAEQVKATFSRLADTTESLELTPQILVNRYGENEHRSLGRALRFRKRIHAPVQVFLGIHMDVVYGHGSDLNVTPDYSKTVPFRRDQGVLHASGAADAKGGLVILFKALETFEASPFASGLGWEVLINPDEEIGSPGSKPLLWEAAKRNHIGFLFEPSLPNGHLVGARKGSGNFAAVVHGRAAHAGRDPHLGRNAIHALAHFIVELEALSKSNAQIQVNVGKIEGGGPLNRVPDLAIARFNIRVEKMEDQKSAEQFVQQLSPLIADRYDVRVEISGAFSSPPKPMTPSFQAVLEKVKQCGSSLGMDLGWESSGGVSDGNKLAAAGLVNVDSLGALGGNIHSPEEFLVLDSLVDRARLTALLLMQLGSGEWSLTS